MLTDEERERLRNSFSAWMALEPFLQDLRLRNCSPRTIREYRKVLTNYMIDTGCFSLNVPRQALTGWVTAMYDRGLQPRSVATRIVCLRSFFGWAVRAGLLGNSPAEALPRVKTGQRLPKALSRDEVRAFFEAVKAQPGERGRRDLVVFTLLYSGGLRVSEAASLRIEDLDLERAMLRMAYGKGNKDRMIDLRPSDVELLRDWVRARTEGWLFPGQDGHLSARVIQQYAREYGRAAGLRRMHPHLLRHSCAEHYLLEGVPITFVQQRLGHASLATTGIYTQLADVERARIARSVELAV